MAYGYRKRSRVAPRKKVIRKRNCTIVVIPKKRRFGRSKRWY